MYPKIEIIDFLLAPAYHAPIATAYHGAALPYAYGGYKWDKLRLDSFANQ